MATRPVRPTALGMVSLAALLVLSVTAQAVTGSADSTPSGLLALGLQRQIPTSWRADAGWAPTTEVTHWLANETARLKPRKAVASAYASARLASMSHARSADRFMHEEGAWTCFHAGWEEAFRWQRQYGGALEHAMHASTRSRLATPPTEQRRWLCPTAAWAPYNRAP